MSVRGHPLKPLKICDTGMLDEWTFLLLPASDAARSRWRSIHWLSARRSGHEMIRDIGVRPIIFSVNCYIATILTMFVAFSLDLKSPGWAMTTVYLTSQPLSGAMRAKAVYRAIGTLRRRRRHGRHRSQSGRCAGADDACDHALGGALRFRFAARPHAAVVHVRAVGLYRGPDRLSKRACAWHGVRHRGVARRGDHARRRLRRHRSQSHLSQKRVFRL